VYIFPRALYICCFSHWNKPALLLYPAHLPVLPQHPTHFPTLLWYLTHLLPSPGPCSPPPPQTLLSLPLTCQFLTKNDFLGEGPHSLSKPAPPLWCSVLLCSPSYYLSEVIFYIYLCNYLIKIYLPQQILCSWGRKHAHFVYIKQKFCLPSTPNKASREG
jgi:hypothetical protein